LKKLTLSCLLILGFALPSGLAESSFIIYPHERVIQFGDNQAWANPNFNHQNWDPTGSTDSIGVFWLRMKIKCDSITDLFENPGLQIISLGSYEIYWDGYLIGKNGIVGKTKAEEVPGRFITQVPLPDSLLSHGTHIVAFRVSNFHITKILSPGSWNTFFMEEYQQTVKRNLVLTAKIFILAGIYLMAALYYLFLFILRYREKEVFIFSMLCFLFFGLIVMEYLKFLIAYPYHWQLYRLAVIFLLTWFISFLVPFFLMIYFNLSNRKWMSLGIIILMFIATSIWGPGTDLTNEYLGLVMWICSIGILLFATLKKKKEASLVLIIFFISGLIIYFYNYGFRAMGYSYDISLFISFSLLVLSMMYLLAKRASEQKEAYKASLLLSTRLQNELLKKNIQPHFIMNTLSSLIGWVEESPKDSVLFIEALSGEFEIMSKIAEKKLIPLEQEIELCQKHIQIMQYRKEIEYVFEVENMPKGEMIPPAIFHTILENGITHNLPNEQNQLKMTLSYTENNQAKTYTFNTIGENRPTTHKKSGGTGMKYIQSRLAENYGTHWSLDSKATSIGWETKIVLHKYNSRKYNS